MRLARFFLASLVAACFTGSAAEPTPAHKALEKFRRGANLGNYLEAPPGQNWGAKYTEADFKNISAEGFDHVRLPIGWHHYAGPAPDFVLSKEIFQKVDFLVTNALKHGLSAIVNIHHFDEFTTNPAAHSEKFYKLWEQIAAHYKSQPMSLAFELLNEPKDAATTLVMNPIYGEAIKRIRKTNPDRTIFVGPGKWNQVTELANLKLPENDKNLIVTVHCYDPFYFTHQGASWAGPDPKATGIVFPGPPAKPLVPDPALGLRPHVVRWIQSYNSLPTELNPSSPQVIRKAMKTAHDWGQQNNRPIHVGEFGCYTKADPESRARFYSEFRKILDEYKLAWAVWDWKAGFRYWEDKTSAPAPGMRKALFGKD